MLPQQTQQKRSSAKSISILGLITGFSRILGLLREMLMAAILGTSFFSDAFTLAFTLPNFFRRLFSEGAFTTAFVPNYSKIKSEGGARKAAEFATGFFWYLSLVLLLFCLTAIVVAPWVISNILQSDIESDSVILTVYLTRIMIFYVLLISVSAIFQGILNVHSIFWVSGLTPVLLNVCIISCGYFFSQQLENPATGFAIGVLMGGTVQLLFQLPYARTYGFRFFSGFTLNDPEIKRAFLRFLPVVFGVGIYQINILVGNLVASALETGAVSSLKFSNRLVELIIGVLVVSMTTVILPMFSELFREKERGKIKEGLERSISVLAFVTFPIIFGVMVTGPDIVDVIFGRGAFGAHSASLTSQALSFHIVGLSAIAWNKVLITCFQAAGAEKITVLSGIGNVLVNIVLAVGLSITMGHGGIALALSLTQIIHMLVLVFFLKELGLKGRLSLLLKPSIISSLLAALLMYYLLGGIASADVIAELPSILRLLLLVLIGFIIFVVASLLFRNGDLRYIIGQLKSRSADKTELPY